MVEKRDETYIDPNFFLPPNVFDIRYIDKDDTSEGEDVPELSESDSGPTDIDTIDTVTAEDDYASALPETTNPLPIPDGLTVVSQTVKAAAGGGYLVDIVVDIPDMPGVENFDVAVTKA
jgi:hypothetical protein